MTNMDQYEVGNGPFGPVVNGTMVIEFYQYRPNEAAGYAFMALFALMTIAHLFYMIRLKAYIFVPFILGGIAETFGYYGRALSHNHPARLGPWIQQNLLILVATPLLTATIYMSLARIIDALQANKYSLISTRWLSKIYILIDILCLVSQLAGTVMPASGDAKVIELSRKIILGGLLVQLVVLVFFCVLTGYVLRALSRREAKLFASDAGVNWKAHLWTSLVAASLVLVRSLVRAVEYAQGEHGFIISHEVFIYLFDAAAMWLVMVAYLLVHPSRLVRDAYLLLEPPVQMDARRLTRADEEGWSHTAFASR
ncbi:hypothetical protein NHJ13734_003128 [Beauveria thailandica]